MSVEAMAWALRVPIGGNGKVVLLGLANHADPDGSEAWPCVDTLSTYACCDRRTVQRHLRQLEVDGWITPTGVHYIGGRRDRMTSVYTLAITGRQEDAPSARSGMGDANGAASVTARGGTSVPHGAALAPPEPSLVEPPIEPPDEPPTARERAGVRQVAPVWKYRGKTVPQPLREVALACLAAFNAAAGEQLPALRKSNGEPSDHLKRITGAVLDHPELTADDWRVVVERNFQAPWWDSGSVGVGVIFGPAVVDRAIQCDGMPRGRGSQSSQLRRIKPKAFEQQEMHA